MALGAPRAIRMPSYSRVSALCPNVNETEA
jgi:hypothetical protein